MEYKKLVLGKEWPEGFCYVDGKYFAWDSNNQPLIMRYAHQVGWLKLNSDNLWGDSDYPKAILWPPIDKIPAGITFFA